MTQKITGEAPFQVLATNFSISPSQQNYVLQISADGTNYSDLFTVSAGQTKMVTNVANGSYYRLKNNNSEVTINWRTQCNDGQGGGGGSYILPAATEQTLGGIKVGSGLTVQADGTLSATGGSGSGSSYEPYKIELSTPNPEDFTEGDGDNLNAFYAALVADPSIGDGAYIKCGDYIFNMVEYGNLGEGFGEFKFVMTNSESINELSMHFEDSEYNEGFLWVNNFSSLIPSGEFPADPIEGTIVNYDDGEGNTGLYVFDGSDWQPYGGGGDNSSLIPTTEFPADPVEGQIVNYSDERLNVGVLYRYDGSDWQPYGGGEGVVYVTHLSDAEAVAAPVGSLIVLNNETTEYAEASWANNTLTLNYAGLEDETELEIAGWEYYNAWFYLYATNGDFIIRKTRDGYESVDYSLTGDSGTVVLDNFSTRTNTLTYTNSGSQMVVSFSNNIDNHYLINLPILNEHMIYIKVQGGEIAHWNGYTNSEQTEPFQIIYDDYDDFVNFADGKTLLSFKYRFDNTYRYIAVDKDEQAVILYSDSALTTEVARAEYLGTEVQFVSAYNNIYYVAVHWKEDEISFRCSSFVNADNLLPFATEGVHYHRITDQTKATAQDLGLGNNFDSGIPEWNNEGVIVGKRNNYITKTVQFNYGSNSYTNNASIVAQSGENNIPSRMYVPTAGGTSGQVLISNGVDSAPTFQNWIKVVKITSDAYEALQTKDPNTLYVIDDES